LHVAGILLLGLLRLGLVRLLPLLPLLRFVSIVFFAFCGFVMRSLVLSAVSFSVSPSFSSAMTIAWVVSSSSSFLRHHLHHVFLHESYSHRDGHPLYLVSTPSSPFSSLTCDLGVLLRILVRLTCASGHK
jgi:hypothetical protein